MSLESIQNIVQNANPYTIDMLTRVHGIYVSVYNKDDATNYDEGRDIYASNANKFKFNPLYIKKKLYVYDPIQEAYSSGQSAQGETFDSYIEDCFILTTDKKLQFKEEQKFELYYSKKSKIPNRVMQCFEIKEISSVKNSKSIRKVMLKPFN
jgi:hypothetical protein